MHLLPLLNVVGALVFILGGAQLVPLSLAFGFGEADWIMFLYSALAAMATGGSLWWFSRAATDITERDGFAVVTVGWCAATVVGAVPYVLTGALPSYTDAMFESMSGFTTTGASVMYQYERFGQGIFLWRSMTQWFGGMGIIVLALVILPALGIGGMQLYKREVPGPNAEKLTPRLRDTARSLWSVYLIITLVEIVVYYLLGMPPLEAVNHALTTIATGGFSPLENSIAAYNSAAIEWAVTFFMAAAGMNFFLHYRLLFRRASLGTYLRDPEWRLYLSAISIVALMVSAYLVWHNGYGLGQALTKGSFQVTSILTTTGFASDDYSLWGAFPQLLLVGMMITGGCAGSTSGGMKWVRILLMFKFIHTEIVRLIHPRVVIHARFGESTVTQEILGNIFAFIFMYITALGATTLLLTLDGNALLTSIGAAASALGNVGPGLDAVGPVQNYAALTDYSKWVLLVAMLMGRLELMTVIVLFMPQMWRH